MTTTATLLREIRLLKADVGALLAVEAQVDQPEMAKYIGQPALYAREVLQVECWSAIAEVLEAVEKPPYRVLVKSGHKIGKTHALAALINYWFDVYDPGVCITTGASFEAMEDTVWAEVRMQRARVNRPDYFIGPVAADMRSSPEHWAKLFSVNNSTAFQGKHRSRILFLFDESVSVERAMWTVAESMFKGEPGFGWICCCNPTDPSSQFYAEEQLVRSDGTPKWKTFSLSSLDHPNILKQREHRARGIELTSTDLPIPNAVSITQVDDWVQDWCTPIDPASLQATDFEWTFADGSKRCFRPEMDWEARCKRTWPTSATSSVWSDYLFTVVTKATGIIPVHLLPELGSDCARFGDDKAAIHTRWGSRSLSHASRQGLRVTELAGWIMETARDLAVMVNRARIAERAGRPIVTAKEIPLKIDDDGVGGGVVDILFGEGYAVQPVNAGSVPNDADHYLNKRSELWFSTVKRALAGGLGFCAVGSDGIQRSNLDMQTVAALKQQAMAPKWKMGPKGQRVVEKKEETKKRLGRSPDDMDALNLAYYEFGWEAPSAEKVPMYDDRRLGPTSDDAWNDVPTAPSRRPRFGT